MQSAFVLRREVSRLTVSRHRLFLISFFLLLLFTLLLLLSLSLLSGMSRCENVQRTPSAAESAALPVLSPPGSPGGDSGSDTVSASAVGGKRPGPQPPRAASASTSRPSKSTRSADSPKTADSGRSESIVISLDSRAAFSARHRSSPAREGSTACAGSFAGGEEGGVEGLEEEDLDAQDGGHLLEPSR